jgi:uncharacterized protein (TIGR03382 family)
VVLVSGVALATPSGHHWFPSSLPVHYVVFAHTTINGMPANSFQTDVLPRVQVSFQDWTGPLRVACTSWSSTYDGPFSSPADHTAQNSNDSVNRVIWLAGTEWRYSALTLGLTTTLFYPNTGQIIDADMELNNNVTWTNMSAGTGTTMAFDYESVTVHEAGHFLGLDHTVSDTTAVMYPTVNNGQVKRTLATADINDVCSVYPTTTGGLGSPCTSQTMCNSTLVCRAAMGSTSKICTIDCTSSSSACMGAAPYTCVAADTGMACLPPPATADYCKFCTDGTQCSSGNCVTDGYGHLFCASPCSSTAPCPAGSSCIDVATALACNGGTGCICTPTFTAQGALCPSQCTGTTCPVPGFACSNGTCVATGGPGDRCELLGACQQCLICTAASSTEATCQKCCGGEGQGGTCNACTPATCQANERCTPLNGRPDLVCFPTGPSICQSCDAMTACAAGNMCIGGTCHATCDPQSPGNCQACQPMGTNIGICACGSDEQRTEGQGCAPAGGVAACLTGLVCVSGTCRRPCDLANTATCPSGQTCQSIAGTAVCTAGVAGSRCAACNGTTCTAGNVCWQGRCYAQCNVNVPNGPCDSTCVDVGSNINVCACDDQIGGVGSTCGGAPVGACSSGLLCVQGQCLGTCTTTGTNVCPYLTECKLLAGTSQTFVCQPLDYGTGGGSGQMGTDCTATNMCPTGFTCTPNGDGTATCRGGAITCDPNAAVSSCHGGTMCLAVAGSTTKFTCQMAAANSGGCGCQGGAPGVLMLLGALWLSKRRKPATPR